MDKEIKVIRRPVDTFPTGGVGELDPNTNCHQC